MKILLDGMGGDNAPHAAVKGAVDAAAKIQHEIVILGDENRIRSELDKYDYDRSKISIVHTSEVISNEEAPVKAVRTKQDSSLVKGITMLNNGEGDLFISAGSTGAMMAAGLFILKAIDGIDRPAIASVYPILGKGASLLVDAGANSECRAANLLQFACMGDIYMKKVMGVENPKVGLVNIGVEEQKGTSMTKEAYKLLQKSNLNFVGNVEAREIPNGACDVIVADGFVGNVILKLTEGLAMSIFSTVKEKLTSGFVAKVGAALLYNKLVELKEEFDYSEYGGAPLLGIKGPIVKMHGSSNEKAVMNSILRAVPFMEGKVVETIEKAIAELERIENIE